jgi:hypothetical protein
MNAQVLPGWLAGMVLAGGLTASSFAQSDPTPAPPSDNPAAVAPAPPAQSLPDSPETAPVPSKVQLSAGALDVQRLTQAGLSEGVLLAYVTNSACRYSLTPDQIIDLKNTGLSAKVISAMISHDQALPPAPPELIAAITPANTLAVSFSEADGPTIVANDDAWPTPTVISDDDGYAPEQPASLGPVRAPYPVRLNDPIVILKLPSFAFPCW